MKKMAFFAIVLFFTMASCESEMIELPTSISSEYSLFEHRQYASSMGETELLLTEAITDSVISIQIYEDSLVLNNDLVYLSYKIEGDEQIYARHRAIVSFNLSKDTVSLQFYQGIGNQIIDYYFGVKN